MKLTYFGTAASEGMPALYCKCPNCMEARKRRGKDVRSRSQALVNDVLLIDFPADTYGHVLYGGLPLEQISHCLITHGHDDHLYPREVNYLKDGCFSHGNGTMTFYGSAPTGELLKPFEHENMRFVEVKPFESFEVEGHLVTPLPGIHAPELKPLIYLVEKDGKRLLYGNDTGIFDEKTWAFLKGKRLDLVSLDCTHGNTPEISYNYHMTFRMNCQVREKMLELGIADEKTVFYANHFSHNADNVLYDEFVEIAKKQNFEVSYDGCTVMV